MKTGSPIAQPQKRIAGNPPKHLVRWAINKWARLSEYGTQFVSQWFKVQDFLIHIEQYRVTLIGRCAKLIHGFAQPQYLDSLVRLNPNGTVKERCCEYPLPTATYESGCGVGDTYKDCWFQYWYPSEAYATSQGLTREWQRIKKLVRNGTIGFNTDLTGHNGQRAGFYTGEMRKVVYDHISRGYRIPYSYLATKTHGIYTASDQTRWLIEISSTKGIRAKKLNVCTAQNSLPIAERDVLDNLPYIPVPTDFDDTTERDDPAAILILAPGLYDAVEAKGTPIFPECGWAFSETGTYISNVLIQRNVVHDGQTFDYASLITLTIQENPETKKPQDVLWTVASNGWVFGVDGYGAIKYPDYTLNTLLSYSLQQKKFIGLTHATSAPLYCWYDEEVLQTVSCIYEPGTSWTPGSEFDTVVYGEQRIYACFTSPLFSDTQYDRYFKGSQSDYGGEKLYATLPDFEFYIIYNGLSMYKERLTSYTYDETPFDAVLIPFYDRQAVYHGRMKDLNETGANRKLWFFRPVKYVADIDYSIEAEMFGYRYVDYHNSNPSQPICLTSASGNDINNACLWVETDDLYWAGPFQNFPCYSYTQAAPQYWPQAYLSMIAADPMTALESYVAFLMSTAPPNYLYTVKEVIITQSPLNTSACSECLEARAMGWPWGVTQLRGVINRYIDGELDEEVTVPIEISDFVAWRSSSPSRYIKLGTENIDYGTITDVTTIEAKAHLDGSSIELSADRAEIESWLAVIDPGISSQFVGVTLDHSGCGNKMYSPGIAGPASFVFLGNYPAADISFDGFFLGNS